MIASLTHRYSRCLGSRYLNSKLQIYYVLALMVSYGSSLSPGASLIGQRGILDNKLLGVALFTYNLDKRDMCGMKLAGWTWRGALCFTIIILFVLPIPPLLDLLNHH